MVLRALDTIEDDMTLDIATKEPILLDFYNKLTEDGWNFTECEYSIQIMLDCTSHRLIPHLN